MKTRIKLWLLPLLVVCLLMLCTGCGEEEALNFEINEDLMQKCTQTIITQYNNTSEMEQDYYLNDGTELQKTAVSGFLAAESTDHVGAYIDFVSGDDAVSFSNGVDGKVLCSQICKYEHRKVKVTVSYLPNRSFEMDKRKLYNEISDVARQSGTDVASYIMSAFGAYADPTSGLDFTSVDTFLNSYMANYMGEYPFTPQDCEVSAVYSKSELMAQAGKNTAIGMGVVFVVLIFISFVISLLKYLPYLFDADIRKARAEKKKKEEESKAKTEQMIIGNAKASSDKAAEKTKTAPEAAVSSAADDNLINDAELVAVITAAIYAATGSQVRGPAYTFSNDKLVVRSIRRAR